MIPKYPLLNERVAFITGGGRGIGRAIAERFVAHGASVALGDVDFLEARNSAKELNRIRPRAAFAVKVDVADEAALEVAISRTREEFGRLDVGVANAGILSLDSAVNMAIEDWHSVMAINLTGAFLTARACARSLISQGHGGKIIFTGSLMARRGAAQNSAYAAAKFGIMGIMETMAIELAPDNINVNAVNPGQVQTDMIEQLFVERGIALKVPPSQVRDRMLEHIPMRRLAEPQQIADAYVFLASDLSSYITGQALTVDGGWSLV